jgi:hypothetical protein
VLAFNKPAQALFAAVEKQSDASHLLSLPGLPARWWEPGLSGRRKMQIEIGPRVYQVTCTASPLPGEEEQFYVVSFLPVARTAAGDRGSMTAGHLVDATTTGVSNSSRVSPP